MTEKELIIKDKEIRREEVLNYVRENSNSLSYFHSYQDDKEVVMAAVKKDEIALLFASDRLRDDKEVVMAAVKNCGLALALALDRLENDKEVVLAAVKQNGFALEYASDRLRNDKEVVLAAVKQNGFALEYASDRLRDDRKVVFTAIKNNPFALEYASERLKLSKTMIEKEITTMEDLIDTVTKIFRQQKELYFEYRDKNNDDVLEYRQSIDREPEKTTVGEFRYYQYRVLKDWLSQIDEHDYEGDIQKDFWFLRCELVLYIRVLIDRLEGYEPKGELLSEEEQDND